MKRLFFFLLLVSSSIVTSFAQSQQLEYAFHFESAKSQLPTEAKNAIQKIALQAQTWVDHTIIIKGHTDNVGTIEYNKSLSQARAEEVKMLFAKAGVPSTRIQIEALGETQPLVSNNYKTGRQQNRRVEILLTNKPADYYQVQQQKQVAFVEKVRNIAPSFVLESPEIEQYLTTPEGTKIHVPSDAFDVPPGTPVEVTVQEAYKKSDMILQMLNTTSNGMQLISGGMVKVEAFANGKPVALKAGKALEINVPNLNPDPQMQLFFADNSGETINWVNPQALTVSTPLTQSTFEVVPLANRYNRKNYDTRHYYHRNNRNLASVQSKSKAYISKATTRPVDSSSSLLPPRSIRIPDSTGIVKAQEKLTSFDELTQAPCTTFACKFKALFTSKKKKAKEEKAAAQKRHNLSKQIELAEKRLEERHQDYAVYQQKEQAYYKEKKRRQQVYQIELKAWKSTFPAIDSNNFDIACENTDLGYIQQNYKDREVEAYQLLYNVDNYTDAYKAKKNLYLKNYIQDYAPLNLNLDSVGIDNFADLFKSPAEANKEFYRIAYEKRDTNYILWRKGSAAKKRALLVMYDVSSIKEVRGLQLIERIEANRAYYEDIQKRYGLSSLIEAYKEEINILKEQAAWKQQAGYVFKTANLGNWINCDYFPGRTNETLITQRFELSVSPQLATTYLVFKDINSVMKGAADYQDLRSLYAFNNIPKDKTVQVVSFYLDIKGIPNIAIETLNANDNSIPKLTYQPMSISEFKQALIQLDA